MHERLLCTPLFTVEHRVHERPGRSPVERDVVVHPGAVVILPVLDDGRIVMIRNHRFAVDEELWELPAGTREAGESPSQTAQRELEEETGYRASAVSPMLAFYTSPGILTEYMHAFEATGLTPVGRRPADDESIVCEILEPDTARRMLFDGTVRDAKTIAVLARYFLRSSLSAIG
ncbi:MAG: NUDIX hydrolase [Phycisphaerae bacterium]